VFSGAVVAAMEMERFWRVRRVRTSRSVVLVVAASNCSVNLPQELGVLAVVDEVRENVADD